MIFFSNLKRITSPANELLLHKYRNKNIYIFSYLKKLQVQLTSFLLYKCRKNRKMKKLIFFFKSEKFTRPANEFQLHKCRNNRKIKNKDFFSNLKNVTSPANEFLLDRIEWKKCTSLLMSFSYMHADRRTVGQRDRRTNRHTFTPC